jgi:hypothetical protein
VCYMIHPSHPPWLDNLIISGEAYKLWSSSVHSLLQPPVTSSLLGANTTIKAQAVTSLWQYLPASVMLTIS